jgi:hypothetical protein
VVVWGKGLRQLKEATQTTSRSNSKEELKELQEATQRNNSNNFKRKLKQLQEATQTSASASASSPSQLPEPPHLLP